MIKFATYLNQFQVTIEGRVLLSEEQVSIVFGKRALTKAAETKCREWLASLMRNGPPKQSKDKYREEAKSLYNVGTKAFHRAWANAIAETGNNDWSKPGRKS